MVCGVACVVAVSNSEKREMFTILGAVLHIKQEWLLFSFRFMFPETGQIISSTSSKNLPGSRRRISSSDSDPSSGSPPKGIHLHLVKMKCLHTSTVRHL